LEYRYDKFAFRVAQGRRYCNDDLWMRLEKNRAGVGVTDFLQKKSGDATFVELVAEGTHLAAREATVLSNGAGNPRCCGQLRKRRCVVRMADIRSFSWRRRRQP
jgi:hypothetical protein